MWVLGVMKVQRVWVQGVMKVQRVWVLGGNESTNRVDTGGGGVMKLQMKVT